MAFETETLVTEFPTCTAAICADLLGQSTVADVEEIGEDSLVEALFIWNLFLSAAGRPKYINE